MRNTMTIHTAEALAFERKNANKRAVFSMQQTLTVNSEGIYQSRRNWFAVESCVIAEESVEWKNSLLSAFFTSDSLGERSEATNLKSYTPFQLSTRLNSPLTKNQTRYRELSIPYEPVTLSSMPFIIAKYWKELRAGHTKFASYLVLKVQRAAVLKIQLAKGTKTDRFVNVEVIPTNFILKMLFGKTVFTFINGPSPHLVSIDGLLDPRDRKHNGRWHEYFGLIEFSEPWDLSSLVYEGRAQS